MIRLEPTDIKKMEWKGNGGSAYYQAVPIDRLRAVLQDLLESGFESEIDEYIKAVKMEGVEKERFKMGMFHCKGILKERFGVLFR